jgi:hypothetical protein
MDFPAMPKRFNPRVQAKAKKGQAAAPAPKVPWTGKQLMQMVLPGVLFAVIYLAVILIFDAVYKPAENRWPKNFEEWSSHFWTSSLTAIGTGGTLGVFLCIWFALKLMRAGRPGKTIPREEIALAAFYLFLLNAAIGYGGAFLVEQFGRLHQRPVTKIPEAWKSARP